MPSILTGLTRANVVGVCVLAAMRMNFVVSVLLLLLGACPLQLWAGVGAERAATNTHGAVLGITPLPLRSAPASAPRHHLVAEDSVDTPLADTVLLREIVLAGHRRTRARVIFREMGLKRGARVPSKDLKLRVEQSYNTLMNTGLFASLDIEIDTLSEREVQLILNIRETWYIYPVPVFELADRNFNVWWNEMGGSLDRVNIGAKLAYYNFTGRRDKLRIGYTTGYTREYEFSYRHPYINPAGSLGLEVSYRYQRQREQNYQTIDNRQVFFALEDDFVYRRSSAELSLRYRRELYVSHQLELGYRNVGIADTIAEVLNPDFLGGGRNSQQFARLSYIFNDDHRDVRNYPWAGYQLKASITKDGLGITGERDGLTLGGSYAKFWALNEKYSINVGLAAKYSLIRTQQPFLENRAIGFGSNGLVGYQFYVVDGLDMAIWRAGVRREIFRTKINLGKYAILEAFRRVPIRLLVAFQFNQGIANSPFAGEGNSLNNRLLTGMSAGLDAVFFFDMVGSLQYNRNHLGEDGIFLALQLSF